MTQNEKTTTEIEIFRIETYIELQRKKYLNSEEKMALKYLQN